MRILFLTTLSLGLAAPALAQTAPADTAHSYKNQLGLTASPQLDQFFKANRSLPVGLLYKRQTAPGRLLRLGLTASQNFATRDDLQNPQINDEYTKNGFELMLSVGREYTRPFSQRWVGTAGIDALFGYARYRTDTQARRFNPATGLDPYLNVSYEQFSTLTGAVAPFAGVRYQFARRLYASAETQIALSASRLRIAAQSTDTQLDTGYITKGSENIVIDWSVRLRLRLINQLTVHYLF